MPSTYSPLKIELPATGEQSGTWGNTTNTNLGTALEEAITGSANVTFASGNVVLTLTDTNASQVARNLRLNLIGVTGGSTRTLTVPAIKKLYLVSNNCADSVIVGNSTGATVTVPAGNNIFIYNDGTDVLNAITYITNLNAVAVSAGSVTTTQVDIVSQGDLRLQDTTGGQFVALQAPGTIATSYTLTLPVDDGTNGQALITDGNGVLSWSTAASGDVYGPASATDNAIALFDGTTGKIIKNSLVTIGSTGNTVISVTDNTNAALRITQLGTGDALLVEDSATPDATPVVISAEGSLTIGNTSRLAFRSSFPANLTLMGTVYSPNALFNIARFNNGTGGGGIEFNHSRSGTIGTNTALQSGDSFGQILFNGADGASYITGAQIDAAVDGTPATNSMAGRLVFSTTAVGSATPTERMRINNAGNVGFGSTALTAASIRSSKNITEGTIAYGIRQEAIVQSDVTNVALGIASTQGTVAASFTLASLRQFQAGQGAIGAGSAVTTQTGFYADSSLIGATNNYAFQGLIAAASGRYNLFMVGTADNYLGGSLGIGITSPSAKLHAVTDGEIARFERGSNTQYISISSTTSNNQITATGANAKVFAIYNSNTNSGSNLDLGTNNTNRFSVTYEGNFRTTSTTSTTMANGFIYIPAAGGVPTGVPTAVTGSVAMYYDSTNNQFYIYNGAWRKVALA